MLESMANKVKPLEMALFGAGGYYLGGVLNSTGIPTFLYNHVPLYKQYVDEGYGQTANGSTVFADGGGVAVTKTAGVATFLYALAKSAKSGLSGKTLNTLLPFSLGAMLDGPSNDGTSGSSPSGDRW
jgi:hypothetical protein